MERAAHLRLVGLTAVEDRLQELVPEAIADFLQAGIKIWSVALKQRVALPYGCSDSAPALVCQCGWLTSRLLFLVCFSQFLGPSRMLTGDKRETAKNIGLACNLLDPEMESQTDLLGSLSVDDMNRVVEITGDWVSMCNNTEQLRQMFDILGQSLIGRARAH
jgi:magnesium-transporting ATPase (P-type)